MMTSAEIEEFIANPGRVGVWSSSDTKGFQLHPMGKYRYRKWNGKIWCTGYSTAVYTEQEAITNALISNSPGAMETFRRSLELGTLPVFICDLDGNRPNESPEQLDLFL